MAMGMTPDEFWDGENELPKYYREAKKIRDEEANHHAWLQGLYIYDAIGRLAPALKAFSKRKPEKYMAEPYPLTKDDADAKAERDAKTTSDKMFAYMQSKMTAINKKFMKGSESDANTDR